MSKDTKLNIIEGNLDINAQEIFFGALIKGLLWNLNDIVKVRGIDIPHIIVNTGDDKMYLAVKGQDLSIEPGEVSNENYVTNIIPRCIVTPGAINLLLDQLSNPYTRGTYNITDGTDQSAYNSEFRRMPFKFSFSLKYYFDSFTDALEAVQSVISNFAVVKTYSFIYMGQKINCSYTIGDGYNVEKMLEFDGLSAEAKYKTFEFDIEVESNFPIFYNRTTIENTEYINQDPRVIVRSKNNQNPDWDDVQKKQYEISQSVKGGITTK